MSKPGYRLQEVDVVLTISDGKLTAESKSGPKGGVVRVSVSEGRAHLSLDGAGSDEATVTLSGSELSHFRSIVDAALSDLSIDRREMSGDSRMLDAGYGSLVRHDDGYAVTIDGDALEMLGLLNEDGSLAGGGRQVQTSVLNSGTAIFNLLAEDETEFEF